GGFDLEDLSRTDPSSCATPAEEIVVLDLALEEVLECVEATEAEDPGLAGRSTLLADEEVSFGASDLTSFFRAEEVTGATVGVLLEYEVETLVLKDAEDRVDVEEFQGT
ncbi:hypothetical protein HDV05_002906, partial [Chytridiales sp. JEL 0842]